MKKYVALVLSLFFFLGCAHALLALDDPLQKEKEELSKEILHVKYIDARRSLPLLHNFKSAWGKIQAPDSKTFIVEDLPPFLDKIKSILKEIDVKPVDLQFDVELIQGAMSEGEGTDRALKSDAVMKELTRLLSYRSFKRLDSSLIKVQDNERSFVRLGGSGMSFRLEVRPRHIKEEKGDSFQVELRLSQNQGFKPDGNERILTLIDTTLTLNSGERTVVGVSKLNGGDKALILILTGKALR